MGFKAFVIFKGFHRSTIGWNPFLSNTLKFSAGINSSMWYESESTHINKLFGFSDGGLNHHKNSIRIGWRPAEEVDKFELFSYTYVDNCRKTNSLGTVTTGMTDFKISVTPCFYSVFINGNLVEKIPRSSKITSRYKHLLYPYFGGKKRPPHNMIIPIKWEFFNF